MKFEYIILLILAFNVVTALIKKRKADAEASPKAPAPPSGPRSAREETARSRAPAQTQEPAKKTGLGRDLLEQIAKELGLETETSERPRPEASPYVPEGVPEVVAVVPPATHRAPRKVTAPVAEAAPAEPSRRALAQDVRGLREREGLRRAMIVKEILGPPVSRR